MARQPQHVIDISIAGQKISGWTDYEISSSMTEAVDHFTMTRPYDSTCYGLCRPDSPLKVRIDGVTIIDGITDDREKGSDRGGSTMTITGRDKVGRMVQESAPLINYNGELTTIIAQLASPWFGSVTLSNARNRAVRLGKKRTAVAADEAIVKKVRIKKSWMGKTWRVEPGQARWKIANDLCSEASLMLWASADGKELIIGQPDYTQGTTFLVVNPATSHAGLNPTCRKLVFKESVADRYSLIMAVGAGNGDTANYGASTVTRKDVVRNGPGIDGTGKDFQFPKRLIMSERSLQNVEEAAACAQRDMNRRDFHAVLVSASMNSHGQIGATNQSLLYAPDTLARVIDAEQDPPVDDSFMIYSCRYKSNRDDGETTDLQMVPKGTIFAQ